jgi:hypothetical protein
MGDTATTDMIQRPNFVKIYKDTGTMQPVLRSYLREVMPLSQRLGLIYPGNELIPDALVRIRSR